MHLNYYDAMHVRGAHVTVGAAAEVREDASMPFPFRRGRHGPRVSRIPFLLCEHSKREFSKASRVVETAARLARSPVLSTGRKVDVPQLRAAFNNTEFRPKSGCDRRRGIGNPPGNPNGPSIKFW